MNEKTNKAGATSGQNVPKSPKSKFRHKSQQEQTAASKLRMEKRGEKLEKAKEKLAKQKPPKPPGPVRRVAGTVGGGVHGYVHGKIFEVEQENVGTEGAHRSELVGESALRHGKRFVQKKIREHPAKAVRKAESRHIKATADYHYRMAAQEHPEMQGNALSRLIQKQKIKRQYAKQAREAAKQGAKAAEKTAVTTEKLAARAVGFVKRHPVGVLLFVAVFLLLVMMQSCMSSLATLGNGTAGAVGASTYPAEDADLLGAEAAYSGMEAELQNYLDTYTSTHSYDEYHFDLDEIEHDPYVLLSIISAWHEGEWTLAEVQDTLQMLFDRQYTLTETVVTETRYDAEGDPYTWYICYVTLESENLSHLPVYILGEEQLSRYALYMATLGNRPDLTRDLLYDEHTNKQFITVQTSGGSTFYIVIDYDKPTDEDAEQYETYFFSVVDEADLLAALEASGTELPECTCTEKCVAGAINMDCPVCSTNMTECVGAEPEPEPVEEPEPIPDPEPEQTGGNTGALLFILAVALVGGGAGWYFKVYRLKQQRAAETEEDYGDELETYDDTPPWDEEDEDETEGDK